jgi:hypothetical protein
MFHRREIGINTKSRVGGEKGRYQIPTVVVFTRKMVAGFG